MVMAAILGSGVVLVAGLACWMRLLAADEEQLTTRCHRCERKFRYPARQTGRYAVCPGCKTRVALTDDSPVTQSYHVRRRLPVRAGGRPG